MTSELRLCLYVVVLSLSIGFFVVLYCSFGHYDSMVFVFVCFFFFNQKTAYVMRISDWSSDVCSSDLDGVTGNRLSLNLFEQSQRHACRRLEMLRLDRDRRHRDRRKPQMTAFHRRSDGSGVQRVVAQIGTGVDAGHDDVRLQVGQSDRKSTRLNSSH